MQPTTSYDAHNSADATPAAVEAPATAPAFEDLSHAALNLVLAVDNDGEIYRLYKAPLEAQIVKRLKDGKPVELNYLAGCSSMAKLTYQGVKACRAWDISVNKDDRRAAALYLAACIIEDAKCEVE